MILEGIVALIVQAGSGLQAITASRIFPLVLPENFAAQLATAPAITFKVVGANSKPALTSSGPQRWRIQFDCWGARYMDAKNVREALRKLLNGFQGALPDGTVAGSILWIQALDDFANDARQYCCSCEFYILFAFQD